MPSSPMHRQEWRPQSVYAHECSRLASDVLLAGLLETTMALDKVKTQTVIPQTQTPHMHSQMSHPKPQAQSICELLQWAI